MEGTRSWQDIALDDVPTWFQESSFGVWFCWGPYSVPAYASEWYPRLMHDREDHHHEHHVERYGEPSEFGYHDFVPEFTAEDFDAEAWVDLCVEAGADFVGLVVIHHDGFAMWDSDLTRWNAGDMGPQRDVLGELVSAARDRDLPFIAAFHHAWKWWYYPRVAGDPPMDPAYADLYGEPHEPDAQPPESYYADWRDTTLEVIEGYRPDGIYFDWGWGMNGFVEHDQYRKDVVETYYDWAEDWGREVTVFHKRQLPVGVGVIDYERKRRTDLATEPWLTDTSIDREAWSHVQEPNHKDVRTMVQGFVDRLSKNGRTFMNIPPRADGTIPEPVAKRLRRFGEWLDTNAAAVDGTNTWWQFGEGPTTVPEDMSASSVEFTGRDVRFMAGDGVAYAMLMDWPANGRVELTSNPNNRVLNPEKVPEGSADATVTPPTAVELLGAPVDVNWECTTDETLLISMPDTPPGDLEHVYTLELRF